MFVLKLEDPCCCIRLWVVDGTLPHPIATSSSGLRVDGGNGHGAAGAHRHR